MIFKNRKPFGIRGRVPSGYVIGRRTPGDGDPEFISADGIADLALQSPIIPAANAAQIAASLQWTAGDVSSLGTGLSLADGVLSATGGGSSAGGLFSQVMSATPTQASTGFTTWLNQPTGSTVADVATGVAVSEPSQLDVHTLAVLSRTVPSTPYSFTALLAYTNAKTGIADGGPLLGFSDGRKAVFIQPYTELSASGSSIIAAVAYHTALTSGTRTGLEVSGGVSNQQVWWVKIFDDGTNIYFYWSGDGATWAQTYSEARTAHLASISDIIFGADAFSGAMTATLLSFTQGTS